MTDGLDSRNDTATARPALAHLRRLWRFLAPYRGRIAAALFALMTAAGCVLALGQGLRHEAPTSSMLTQVRPRQAC